MERGHEELQLLKQRPNSFFAIAPARQSGRRRYTIGACGQGRHAAPRGLLAAARTCSRRLRCDPPPPGGRLQRRRAGLGPS
jgi:hypothetical protein